MKIKSTTLKKNNIFLSVLIVSFYQRTKIIRKDPQRKKKKISASIGIRYTLFCTGALLLYFRETLETSR